MAERIVNRNAEALIIGHLASVLTVPVSQAVPNPRPASFVTVRRVGGVRRQIVIDAATLAIEAWSSASGSATVASDLAELARSHVNAMPGDVAGVVHVSEFAGPAYLPDPLSTDHRYSFTVSVRIVPSFAPM